MKFSRWVQWENRNSEMDNTIYPGIYIIVLSHENIEGKAFHWRSDIIYVGMTNAVGGLKSRLQQFDNTIKEKHKQHGGADRVLYNLLKKRGHKYKNYKVLIQQLYVSACHHKCDVKSNKPKDLRIMGDIAKQEYECLAIYVQKFRRLPDFNDKKKSPKK